MYPPYTEAEAQGRETFLALMWSLSYPGRPYNLPSTSAFGLIAQTLLDLETSFYTPDAALTQQLSHTGARALPIEQAAYHFYAQCGPQELADISRAAVGTMQYPDEAATLMIGCTLGTGTRLTWRGPGIKEQAHLMIGGVPAEFWALRESVCRFPLGWDIYFVDGAQVVGLPRSTQVTIEHEMQG